MERNEKHIQMTTTPVGRLIGRLAVPTVITMLITSIYNMADTYFVGLLDNTSATVADLITDGCNMGVKSLYKYLNKYPTADKKVKDICQKLIKIEEELCRDLRGYL